MKQNSNTTLFSQLEDIPQITQLIAAKYLMNLLNISYIIAINFVMKYLFRNTF